MTRLFAVLLLSIVMSPAHAGTDDWTGTWETRWREGGARLELHQNGDKVAGKYAAYNGELQGSIVGRILQGDWHQGTNSGRFDFVLSPDGKTFVGRYGTGEWWTGARISTNAVASELVDLSSPRAAMRTFLNGSDAARYDAPEEMVKSVAAVDFGGGSSLPPEVKLARTKKLFDLVDATTFRLFSIPDTATDDHMSLTLPQVGTNAELSVHFSKVGESWKIVMPDDASLAASAKALFARSNGHAPGPEDYKRRRTPSDAFRVFTRAFHEWDDGGRADALAALDLSAVPAAIRTYQGELVAQYLVGILNRIGLPEPQEIPDDPNSAQPYILFSHPAGQIAIGPTGTGSGATWAFTRETVHNVRSLFAVVEDLPPIRGRTLPQPKSAFFKLRQHVRGISPILRMEVGPLEVWQIIGWMGVLVIGLGLGFLAAEILMLVLFRTLRTQDALGDRRAFRFAVWGAVGFSIYKLIIPAIGLSDEVKQVSVGVTGVLLVLSFIWLGWIAIDAVGRRFFGNSNSNGKQATMDNIVVSLLFGLLKLGLLVVGLVFMAIELSLPYESIIASLSIGGLAVAFASRETLSNVFGAGVLAIDRPFKRGDYISAGGVDGTVESVGIRSTRVRTTDDSLIIIPNGKLSDAFVNNLGSRRFHLGTLKLPLPYSTSVSQLESLMSGVRAIVDAVPQIASRRTLLALSTIGTGIQLAVSYSIDVSRGGDETAITNGFVLDVLKFCEQLDIRASAV